MKQAGRLLKQVAQDLMHCVVQPPLSLVVVSASWVLVGLWESMDCLELVEEVQRESMAEL